MLVDARLSDSGVLVLTDAFYPGWKVFVDGKEHTIRRANYLFRGVELPSGAHQVEFVYDPLSFKIGLIVSLLTVVFLIAVPLASAIRRKRLLRQSARIVFLQSDRALSLRAVSPKRIIISRWIVDLTRTPKPAALRPSSPRGKVASRYRSDSARAPPRALRRLSSTR